MKFADNRKSYVTANLSANGEKEMDSEEDEIKMDDDGQASSEREHRK